MRNLLLPAATQFVWNGHSLRLGSGQALSVAFDVDVDSGLLPDSPHLSLIPTGKCMTFSRATCHREETRLQPLRRPSRLRCLFAVCRRDQSVPEIIQLYENKINISRIVHLTQDWQFDSLSTSGAWSPVYNHERGSFETGRCDMQWLRHSWDAVWLWIDWHGRITTVVAIIVAIGGAALVNRAASVWGEVHGIYLYVVSGLAFGIFLATIVIAGREMDVRERAKRSARLEQPTSDSEPPKQAPVSDRVSAQEAEPTLISLMDTSFPSLNKLWGKPELHFDDGTSLQIRSALYFDLFTSGSKFLGFYVPHSARTLEVFGILAAHAIELGDALGNGGLKIICKVPGDNPQTVSDLRYSGKVYLYHEEALTHRQMAEAEEIFKSHELSVVLRGPDFLATAWIAWKQKSGASRAKSNGIAITPPSASMIPQTPKTARPEVTLDYTHPRRSFAKGQQLKSIRNRPFTLAVSKESAYNIEIKPLEIGGAKAIFTKQAILHISDGKKEVRPTIVTPDGPAAFLWRHEFDWLAIDEWDHKGDISAQLDIEIQIEYEDGNGVAWGTKEILHFMPITLETLATRVEFIGPLVRQRAS